MHSIGPVRSARAAFALGAAVVGLACGPAASDAPPSSSMAGGASGSASATGGSAQSSAGSLGAGSGGVAGSTGLAGGSGDGGSPALGGAPAGGAASGGAGGTSASGGSSQVAGSGGAAAGASGSGNAGGPPVGCNLPATVSFKNDLQKFLNSSCNGSGCHVIDDKSTMSAGGYNHAYDWITATAHSSSCPTGAPKRFEVVIAVIENANPPSCSKSRIMPPDPNTHAPLTPCQVATLKAWLAEPMVTQLHRADDTSPTTPYPMPPFN